MPSGCRFRSLPGKLERVPSIYHVSLHVYNWRVTNRSVSCHACRVRASFASWLRFDAERRGRGVDGSTRPRPSDVVNDVET